MERILLAHGGGGEKTQDLINGLFLKHLTDPVLHELDDAATLGQQVFTIDSYVVSPLFFPGGDIGRLAVSGTVNDIAVMGARPLYMSLAFIIEEGLEIAVLEKILQSIAATTAECGVRVVTGDTKVVERGKGDGLYLTSSGLGERVFFPLPAAASIREGDSILISGSIGLHALSILAARGQFGFSASIASDVAPLWSLVESLRECGVHFMRDPTRGGVAQTLNEIAGASRCDCQVEMDALPLDDSVRDFCEILGYDPLYLANEGKVLVIVAKDRAAEALARMRQHPLGVNAAQIGQVCRASGSRGRVFLRTKLGTDRLLMPPAGELLPRIC